MTKEEILKIAEAHELPSLRAGFSGALCRDVSQEEVDSICDVRRRWLAERIATVTAEIERHNKYAGQLGFYLSNLQGFLRELEPAPAALEPTTLTWLEWMKQYVAKVWPTRAKSAAPASPVPTLPPPARIETAKFRVREKITIKKFDVSDPTKPAEVIELGDA